MLIGEELAWGCSGIATSIVANTLGSAPVLLAGTEEQQRRWIPPLVEEPLLASFGAHRAERGLGRLRHQDDRRPPRRRVRPERLEDVHHERRPRRVDGRLRVDRPLEGPPRALRLRRPDGRRRRDDREAPRQDGPALDRHVARSRSTTSSSRPRTGSARRARASRSRCRRSTARVPAPRPAPSASRRPPTSYAVEYAQAARHVRQADRDEPGRQLHDRRHGDRDRGGAAARLAGGVDARPGQGARRSSPRSRSASPPTRR